VACGNELLENGGKLLGDLLERALNGLVLALVKMCDEFLDGFLGRVEFCSSLEELVLLGCEAVVLLKRLLVDVLVLFEGVADLFEARVDLLLSVSVRGSGLVHAAHLS
jgi:hypothetical protein